jgi:branched-chain amino acid transport system ATP-binding protein
MLEVEALHAGYGPVEVLHGVSLAAAAGQVTALMGRNGAGKTTLLRAVMGLTPPSAGRVRLDGTDLAGLPAHRIPRAGIGYVPQGRRLFGPLTVAENLALGLAVRPVPADTRDRVLALFPRLRERLGQPARTLSGGEQQMLAIARALCLAPRVLMLDEPTEGLQPSMIAAIEAAVAGLKAAGVAVLLVEQRAEAALRLAERIVFLAEGHVADRLDSAGATPDHPAFRSHVGV